MMFRKILFPYFRVIVAGSRDCYYREDLLEFNTNITFLITICSNCFPILIANNKHFSQCSCRLDKVTFASVYVIVIRLLGLVYYRALVFSSATYIQNYPSFEASRRNRRRRGIFFAHNNGFHVTAIVANVADRCHLIQRIPLFSKEITRAINVGCVCLRFGLRENVASSIYRVIGKINSDH